MLKGNEIRQLYLDFFEKKYLLNTFCVEDKIRLDNDVVSLDVLSLKRFCIFLYYLYYLFIGLKNS